MSKRGLALRLTTRAAAFAAGPLLALSVAGHAADPAAVAEGMRLYLEKGVCQGCHGWAGDGRKTDNQMPDGANLRETALDRDMLVMTIKCGRPGRDMPAYDRLAYSDGRCYGMKQADLRAAGLRLADPPATLQPREIDLIVDFMFSKVIKKGAMDRARCVEDRGSEADVCRELK